MEKKKISKITEAIWCGVKAVAKEPKDDRDAMVKFGLGGTTVRNIRNTASYQEYQQRYMGSHEKGILQGEKIPKDLGAFRTQMIVDEIRKGVNSMYRTGEDVLDYIDDVKVSIRIVEVGVTIIIGFLVAIISRIWGM